MKLISNTVGFMTLTKREIRRFLKVYLQTIVAPLFTNLLFLGVFGGVFRTRQVGIEGVDYLSFLIPGLCAMGAINSAYQNPASSLVQQKYQGLIYDLNTWPLTTFEKLMAFVLGGGVRGLLVGTMTYVASIVFVGYTVKSPFLFFTMLFVLAIFFSFVGVIVGLLAKTFDQSSFFTNIILTPLVYFGGVFFEIGKLPHGLSTLASFNPLFPLIDSVRYAYLGVSEGVFTTDLGLIAFFMTILATTAYKLLDSGRGLKD
jgi:ABC-2 type transport system permease protein